MWRCSEASLIYATWKFHNDFLTSNDLEWPQVYDFWKADVKSFNLMYNFPHFIKDQNLSLFFKFLTLGDLRWPRVNLRTFFWKVDFKSVNLIYSLPYLMNVQNLTYFLNFWPRVTSGELANSFFWKAELKSVILIYILPTFIEIQNLTQNFRNL